jgi:hypothetical protein
MPRVLAGRTLRRAVGAALLALALTPGLAAACMLDNTPSLWANGVRATLTTTLAKDLAHWSPFTVLKAFASGAPVQLTERRADLVRTLSSAELAASFRWEFGDGAVALGHTVTHRYARPGTYRVLISSTAGPGRGWFVFDTALLHIVPPAQVARTNAAYAAHQAFGAMATTWLWLLQGVLILTAAAVGVFVLRGRRQAFARAAREQVRTDADDGGIASRHGQTLSSRSP